MIHSIHSTFGATAGNEAVQDSTRLRAHNVLMENGPAENKVQVVDPGNSNLKGLADLDKDQGNYLDIVVDDNIRQGLFKLTADLVSTQAGNQTQLSSQGQEILGYLFTENQGNNLDVLA